MVVQFPNMFYVDVNRGPAVEQMHQMFLGDALANRIGVYLYQNGEAVEPEPGSSCFGKAILANGGTVTIENGTISGNTIYIDLPAGCYSVEGPIKISVVWTNGTITATVLEGYGNVHLTETGMVIDPGTIIPSVSALIAAINTAVESIPEDYSTLSSQMTALTHVDLPEGGYINGSGEEVASSSYHRTGFIPVNADSLIVLHGFYVGSTPGSAFAYYFYTADKEAISGANGITSDTTVSSIPATAAFVRFSSRISNGETPIAYVSNHVVEMVAAMRPLVEQVPDLGLRLTNDEARISLLESIVGGGQGLTAAQLADIASSGHADRFLSVGDIVSIPWTDRSGDTAVEYQIPFVIVNIADAYDSNDVKHEKAIWLQALSATPQSMVFHAPDRTEVDLTNEPTAVSGWAYVGLSGTTYTALNLSAGDPIPTTYDKVYKTTYTGLALKAVKTGIARWRDSDIRQWLNSTAAKNAGWWTSQYDGATPPAAEYTNLPGFLGGFSTDWQAAFKAFKLVTGAYPDGTTYAEDITYDKVFIPYRANVYAGYGSENNPNWPYWVSVIGTSSPASNVSSAARIISQLGSASAVTWFLRNYWSAGDMDKVAGITSNGGVYYYNSSSAYRATPCVCLF